MARPKNWRRITKPPIRATWPSPAPSGIGRNIILFRNDSFWCRHCALGNLGPVLVTGGGVVEPCALQRRENRTTTLPPDYHRGFRPPFRSKSRTHVRPFLFFASVDRMDQTALTAVGFAFAWWARLHLGKLWSAFVTRKDEHRIIDTGPYRIVRHPIYTGIILAAVAVAVLKGNFYAFTGAFLIVAGFWMKARLEERFLSEQLGPETYAAYRRRAPMLIPFFPS